MIQFQVKKSHISVFGGLMQCLVPSYTLKHFDEFCGTLGGKKRYSQSDTNDKDKEFTIIIKENRKNRSLTANGAMWLALQHLSEYYHTTKWELYLKYLREHGIFEYLAVIPKAVPRVKALFRCVDEIGNVKTESGVELVRLRCYPGSSTYSKEEFAHLLEIILEDAKKIGFSLISDQDRDLLIDEWDKEREERS